MTKTCFIVNPASGQGKGLQLVTEAVQNIGAECEVYTTTARGDGTRFVREYCRSHPDERIRFFACGGDGTLYEVVNGAAGFANAEVSCFPCGSGNDFVKYYGGADSFRDTGKLISGDAAPVDLLKVGDRYSINVVNFGFDTNVCKEMEKARTKPVIGGRNAYTYGIVKSLLTAMKTTAKVYADGELLNPDGKLLLCTLANGRYVGGQFCCAPRSLNDDGLMELCLVKPVSRVTFLRLIGPYKNGLHLDDRRFEKYIVYRRCKKVEIKAQDGFSLTMDGEIINGSEFTCEIAPAALRFAAPTTVVAQTEKQPATL